MIEALFFYVKFLTGICAEAAQNARQRGSRIQMYFAIIRNPFAACGAVWLRIRDDFGFSADVCGWRMSEENAFGVLGQNVRFLEISVINEFFGGSFFKG